VAVLCLLALAALLSGGLVVARAVDGTPAADTTTASPASTGGNSQGDTNLAGAVNTKDGKTVYAIRLKIVQTAADTVDSTNAAAAVASCTDCTTVAIAFEGVLVAGDPSTFDPTNLALAYNVNCSGCTTVAEAYQSVVQTSTRVRITGAGRQEIAAVRRELNGLRTQDLPYAEIVARVAALEARFAAVLRNEVVPVGHSTEAPAADAQDVSDASTEPSAPSESSAAPTPSESTEPTSTPSEEPTPDPTPSAEASESAAPPPSPSPAP
jgi:putative peptide zinc metalloprotease protein